VAEALVEVTDPLETVLDPGPSIPASEVVRALARSLAPLESPVPPPPWLREEQVVSFRRVMAAVERHGGALLADPVGSGKTWIALAVASTWPGRETTVALVPAVLREQWRAAADRLGIPITIVSHQAASRGRLPPPERSLVIVDESHHFRNPTTRRYAHASPWLAGRPVLLLSGTPVVNRLDDLAHQLRLAVRDDCLAGRGCPSLLEALRQGRAPTALGDLVIRRPQPAALPDARRRVLPIAFGPADRELFADLSRLRLSKDRATAALIRVMLWRAFASSPGALAGALARYERLLHHATLADEAGRRVARADIRRLAGPDQDQLVLWELMADGTEAMELAVDDAAPLASLLAEAQRRTGIPDSKCLALLGILADDEPTIVFTSSRDSLHWLRTQLTARRPAWLTGDGAGIGTASLARADVLSWFRPPSARAPVPSAEGPITLLATDVAAEGLDLQRVGRIVHYDLPWTSVRQDQRDGRALRLGALRDTIEIVEFHPPTEIEAALRQLLTLGEKRRLGTRAGLDDGGRWLYRWRSDLAAWATDHRGYAGMSVIDGPVPGWLFGLALDVSDDPRVPRAMPASLVWIGDDGEYSEDPERLVPILLDAKHRAWRDPTPAERRKALTVVAPVVRARLREAMGERWRTAAPGPDQRALGRRVRALAAGAARRRNWRLVELLDQASAWVSGGLTAGEAELVRQGNSLGQRDLLALLTRLLAVPRRQETVVPRLTGVVRVTSFRACQSSEPSSSISTEP